MEGVKNFIAEGNLCIFFDLNHLIYRYKFMCVYMYLLQVFCAINISIKIQYGPGYTMGLHEI